ncbi:hypothetical protein [Streptomyces sp. NPDC097610]|uniref:hypothetical protein n=1 Tax=Streptomyces sp. NPDC097610 TaxID=3157227 RepID=UPI003324787F
MNVSPLNADQRGRIADLIGAAKPARDGLVEVLAVSVRDCAQHDHASQREDWYCQNLRSFCGERMGPVLRRLLEAEAEVERLTAEVGELHRGVTYAVGAAVRSVHQRGHDIALPLEIMEFLTGGAEAAAAAPPRALPRDNFEVVITSPGGPPPVVAEEVRCNQCGGITTQAGFDGQGWTLDRLDRMADRHECLPRVSADDAADAACPQTLAPDESQGTSAEGTLGR